MYIHCSHCSITGLVAGKNEYFLYIHWLLAIISFSRYNDSERRCSANGTVYAGCNPADALAASGADAPG